MVSHDPTEAGEQLERFAQDLQQRAERFTSLRAQLDSASVTERSPGGEVTVTIDGNGVLTGLDLSDRTRGMDPATLSGEIMSCLRRAQATLREQVATVVQDTVGDDPAGSNIVSQYADRFPDPPEETRPERELSLGRLPEDSEERDSAPRRPPRRPDADDHDDEDPGGGSILR